LVNSSFIRGKSIDPAVVSVSNARSHIAGSIPNHAVDLALLRDAEHLLRFEIVLERDA
jgi:hypothetical protein